MNDQYEEIRQELLLTKEELVDRLSQSDTSYQNTIGSVYSSVLNLYEEEKNSMLHFHLREELEDVNRALLKMQVGLYGICEETGEKIPENQLKVLPTARTVAEASFSNKFNHYRQVVSIHSL